MATKKELEEIKALLEELKKAGAIKPEIDTAAIKDAAEAAKALNETMSSINDTSAETTKQFVDISGNVEKLLGHAEKLDGIDKEKLDKAKEEQELRGKISKILEDDIDTRKKNLLVQKELGELERIQNLSRSQALAEIMQRMSSYGDSVLAVGQQFDSISRSLAQATTSGNQYKEMLEDVSVNTRIAGASSAEVSAAISTLHNSFSGFTSLAASQKAEIAEFAVVMDKVGFATADFAKFLDEGTKSMGMSIGEVKTFSSELVSFAEKSGISMQTLSKDLAGVAPKLSAFDKDNGQRIFKEMSLAAKNLGIDMNRLFDITERYTTFEGAASAAGQLNSALGGNFINTLDLMNASLNDPVDTFRLLKQSMDSSGKSFDEMTPAMKKYIAEAAGFSSVSEAARIFSQDIDDASASLAAQAKTQEELNKITQSYTDIQTKLQTLYASFRPILTTIFEVFGKVLDVMIEIANHPIGQFFVFLIGSIGALIAVVGIAVKSIFSFLTPIFLVVQAIRGAGDTAGPAGNKIAQLGRSAGAGMRSMASGINAVGQALTKNIAGFVGFGFAIMLIGTGIAIAALGLAELAKSFAGLGEAAWPAAAAIVGFTIAFGLLMFGLMSLVAGPQAVVAAGAVGLLLAVGGAAILIGAGVALAALGLAELVKSFAGLGATAGPAADSILSFTVAFGLLMVGLLALVAGPQAALTGLAIGVLLAVGGAALLIGAGVALAASGMTTFIGAIKGFPDLGPVVTSLTSFLDIINPENIDKMYMFGVPLIFLALGFEKIAAAVNSINEGATSIVENLALSIEKLASALEKLNTEKLDKLKDFSGSTILASALAPVFAATVATTALTSAATTASTANLQSNAEIAKKETVATKTEQKQEIVIKLDINSPIKLNGREVGKWADNRTLRILDNATDTSGRVNSTGDLNIEQQQSVNATRIS